MSYSGLSFCGVPRRADLVTEEAVDNGVRKDPSCQRNEALRYV